MAKLLASLKKLLSSRVPITKNYKGAGLRSGHWVYNPKRPIFTNLMAQAMAVDPHIKFGLRLIKGPILSQSRFYVDCANEDIRDYINKQITQFWNRAAKYALRSMEYGYYGTEVMYRMEDNRLVFDRFRNIDPLSVRPWIKDGRLISMQIKNSSGTVAADTFVNPPKCFWTVHEREIDRWWGQSRFYGAHIPWYEYNAPDGFRDSRQTYFYRHAFNTGTLYYPQGGYTNEETGEVIPNEDVAQRILDDMKAGFSLALPRAPDESGSWEFVPGQSVDLSGTFMQYGKELQQEMLEAMGVPSELVQAEGTGAYAGRQIPQEAFYSLLQEIVQDIITDFDEQILQPLMIINFGENHCPYTIECYGLLRNLEEDRGNHKDDARQALGAQDGSQGQQTQNPYGSNRGEQLNMSTVVLPHRPPKANQIWSFSRKAA